MDKHEIRTQLHIIEMVIISKDPAQIIDNSIVENFALTSLIDSEIQASHLSMIILRNSLMSKVIIEISAVTFTLTWWKVTSGH